MANCSSYKRYVILAVCLMAARAVWSMAGAADLDEYRDIRIESISGDELVFSYFPENPSWDHDEGENDAQLQIGRCASNEQMGEARIPLRKVLIGIPPVGAPTASVVSVDYEDVGPRQVAVNRYAESSPLDNLMLQKAMASADYPALAAERPYFIRDQRVLELHVNPIRLSGTNTVTGVATKITVRVAFNPAKDGRQAHSRDQGFERIFRATLLNYDQARDWRVRSLPVAPSSSTIGSPFPFAPDWVKVGIVESGLYRIDRADLVNAGIDAAQIDPRTIRLFWRGGKELPDGNLEPRPEFSELAITVLGEEDGSFDSDDYVLFFMYGADFIDIDSSMARPRSVKNAYTAQSFVWLTYGGGFSDPPRRMASVFAAPTALTYQLHERFDQTSRYEEDILLAKGSGGQVYDYYTWYWHSDADYSIPVNLDDFPAFESCSLFVRSKETTITVEVDGEVYDPGPYDGIFREFVIDNFRNGVNTIVFSQYRLGSYAPLLDYFELVHPRFLRYASKTLDFYTHNVPGVHRYSIESQTAGIEDAILLNTSDMYNQVLLTDAAYSDGELSFDWQTDSPQFERFALSAPSQLSEPYSFEHITSTELRIGTGGDLIVVAPEGFVAALDGYLSYRRQQGWEVEVVSTERIYDNFSGGLLDPVAIRDCLRYRFETSGRMPAAALLVGDGCYDFRGYSGRRLPNFVPPYIVESDSSISDENYVLFGGNRELDSDSSWGTDRGVDMLVSRWPVRSSGEIASYVSKLESYENAGNFGPWRNRVTLVADDEFKRGRSKFYESIHTRQSETIANEHIPSHVVVQKIYMTDYNTDLIKETPKARAKVVKSINDGTVLVNYIGHGNPDVWADEHVFVWKEDLYKLTNRERLAVVFNASCSIGMFDSPFREGMAEELFRYADGGAIATIAATRLVYPDPNAELSYKAFDAMLGDNEYSLCEALYVAKLLRQISVGSPISNDRTYVVFGDPLMDFGVPKGQAMITSLEPPALSALDLTTVSGFVADDSGLVDESFSGDVTVTVFDAERKKVKELDEGATLPYILPGPAVFRGKGTVAGGRFSMQFIVPKDISSGETSAKLSSYAVSSSAQASGGIDSIEISGSNPVITDTTGPEIQVLLGSGNQLEGGLVRLGERLTVVLFDSSGVNLSGEVGHGIEVRFDDDRINVIDLTEEFSYYPGDYRSGSADFNLPGLSTGSHTMTIKAWDSANNSGLRTYNIAIGEIEDLRISAIMNYPNPATAETQFSYHLSEPVSSVTIEVYSLAGRLIQTLSNQPADAGYNISLPWNITDGRGDKLANGVYIYKVTASGRLTFDLNGDGDRAQGFGKIVVLR